MFFMTKHWARPSRQSGSRLMERRVVSCEVLESRRLMSTGMLFGQQPGPTANSISPGWETRWAVLTARPENTAQVQVVSNMGSEGLGTVVELGSGSGPIQIASGGSGGATTGSAATSASTNPLTAAPESMSPMAAAVSPVTTLPAAVSSVPMIPATVSPVTTLPAAVSSVPMLPVTVSSVPMIPVAANVGSGGGQGLIVSPANDGVPVTASPIGMPQGTVAVNPPNEIVSIGSDGSTASSPVVSSPVNMLPMITQVGTGSVRNQAVSEGSAGSTAPSLVATPLIAPIAPSLIAAPLMASSPENPDSSV
jgi:hypothetical protein